LEPNATGNPADGPGTAGFDARVRTNQRRLAVELRPAYDFIACGSSSSGSVVPRRLAETGCACVLLLEAGGTDQREHDGAACDHWRARRRADSPDLANLIHCIASQKRDKEERV
jgi:choline dehydrogenase-like flavoprotein